MDILWFREKEDRNTYAWTVKVRVSTRLLFKLKILINSLFYYFEFIKLNFLWNNNKKDLNFNYNLQTLDFKIIKMKKIIGKGNYSGRLSNIIGTLTKWKWFFVMS